MAMPKVGSFMCWTQVAARSGRGMATKHRNWKTHWDNRIQF